MTLEILLNKALDGGFLTLQESLTLFEQTPTSQLMNIANKIRQKKHPDNEVTWIIDRNLNTTNVCVANCKFCNFYRIPGHKEAYITTMEEYREKIKETVKYGGRQLLLQGGHHPDLGLEFYTRIFSQIKAEFPFIKLHALGPPEIVHIATLEKMSYAQVLQALREAGLDSLPGAGAEILSDRVRRLISNGKCSGQEWLDVMAAAHQLNITTSATMMFGHVETIEERLDHIIRIRDLQAKKPKHSKGFIAFVLWPFMDDGTLLKKAKGISNMTTQDEYLRMLALARIMLPNIDNIQASWLTVGKQTAQMCLKGGANDFGSIMIEENVVSAAGASHRFTSSGIQEAIQEAGFKPKLRNQEYQKIELSEDLVDQVINY